MSSLNDPSKFILAGNTIFTVVNNSTGGRFTFKVEKPSKNSPYFVSVLTGQNNESDYTFLGTIFEGKIYRHGKKSHISQNAPSEIVFSWLWSHITDLPECVEIHHEGFCGRCGRTLTVPESILTGFGPECLRKMQK